MKLNVNKKTRNLMIGGLLSIVMAILVSLLIANFKTLEVKAYAQDANSNSANDDCVVTIVSKHDGNTQTYNYDSFGDAWFESNTLNKFLDRNITFILNKDVELYNSQIENPNSDFFKNYQDEYNQKCFGCKGNGEQYQGKGNNDHFLLAMPGSGKLTVDLNGHKLAKSDSFGIYVITPTLQIDHRNVNLVSNNEIKSEEDYGKIDAVTIFNDNQDSNKKLSIKNIKFDAKIFGDTYAQINANSGVRCKTQYGLEIDSCLFTHYSCSSPVEVGSTIDKNHIDSYTNETIIKNTKFISNIAEEGWGTKTQGGAIHADGFVSYFNIDNCTFNSNSALENGGALMFWGAGDYYEDNIGDRTQIILKNCTFESNKAGKNGGAICNNNRFLCTVDNKFLNNSAANRGGAVYVGPRDGHTGKYEKDKGGLSFNTFSDYDELQWRIKIINNETIFEGNHACNGGAMDCYRNRRPLFAGRVIFKNNSALNRGGAINFNIREEESGGETEYGIDQIALEKNTYLYARNNYLPDREENIRLECNSGLHQYPYTRIYLLGQIDPNSEFGIWTHQRDHQVVEWRNNDKELTRLIRNWVGSHLRCDNDCGGKAWFEVIEANLWDYVKYWRD